ncbi:MAG: hypothetical protein WBM86_19605 [Waterburya sp.]
MSGLEACPKHLTGKVRYGDKALHERALALARSLNLSAAYDAHYLALAERVNAAILYFRQKIV